MVLRSVSRDYSKKNRVLEFLIKIFGQVDSAPLAEQFCYLIFAFKF